MEFALRRELESSLLNLGSSICAITENGWGDTEKSPFHLDHILRRKGEVLQELTCKTVSVTATSGDSFNGNCYLDGLPIRMGSEHLLLLAGSRLLVTPEDIAKVPCSPMTAPLFITQDGRVLTADPEVKEVDLQLSHETAPLVHALDLQQGAADDVVFTELLYSPDEIKSFSEFLSYNRVKDAASLQLVGDYCENNPQCGSYNPETAYNFDLDHIADEIPSPLRTLYRYLDKCARIGSLFGFVLLLLYIGSFFKTIFDIVRYRFRGFYWTEALKMARQPPPPPSYQGAQPLQEPSWSNIPVPDRMPSAIPLTTRSEIPPTIPNTYAAPPQSSAPPSVLYDARGNRVAVPVSYNAADRYTHLDPLLSQPKTK